MKATGRSPRAHPADGDGAGAGEPPSHQGCAFSNLMPSPTTTACLRKPLTSSSLKCSSPRGWSGHCPRPPPVPAHLFSWNLFSWLPLGGSLCAQPWDGWGGWCFPGAKCRKLGKSRDFPSHISAPCPFLQRGPASRHMFVSSIHSFLIMASSHCTFIERKTKIKMKNN